MVTCYRTYSLHSLLCTFGLCVALKISTRCVCWSGCVLIPDLRYPFFPSLLLFKSLAFFAACTVIIFFLLSSSLFRVFGTFYSLFLHKLFFFFWSKAKNSRIWSHFKSADVPKAGRQLYLFLLLLFSRM